MRGEVTREMFECVPEIDFNSGYRYFLGNMGNYTKALMSILKSIKSKLPILHSMHLSEEYEGLRMITQTLRKMLGNIGASRLAESSYQLELALFIDDETYIQEQLEAYILGMIALSENLETLLKKADAMNSADNKEVQNSFLNYDFTKTKESIKRSNDLLGRKII